MGGLAWCPGGAQKKPIPTDCDQIVVVAGEKENCPRLATLKIKDGVLQPSSIYGAFQWDQINWYLPIRSVAPKISKK